MSNRKRISHFLQTLSFNAVELAGGCEILTLCQGAVPLDKPHRLTEVQAKKSAILSAGLFGGSSNTPTPQVIARDVEPKPEDFVVVPFRFISKTIVGGDSWKATDFSKGDVLKASLDLFDRTPIYSDHVACADNWAGIVSDAYWQGQVTSDGSVIPAGISGNANIDSKTQYALARGILIGAVGSNSVTVQFDWQPSHNFDSVDDFYSNLGNISSKDDKMVRRVVNEVKAYFETSMLLAGADPFAKKLDVNGKPIKIDRTAVYFSKVGEPEKHYYEDEKKFVVFVDNNKELLSLSKAGQKPEGANPGNNSTTETDNSPMKNAFLLAFLKAFGQQLGLSFTATDDMDFTEAQTQEALTAMSKLSVPKPEDPKTAKAVSFAGSLKFVNDKGEVSAFDPQTASGEYVVMQAPVSTTVFKKLTDTEKELTEAKPLITIGTNFVKAQRDEAIRLAKLTAGDKFEPTVEATINAAAPDAVEGLLKQFGGEAVGKFGATCTKCNSAEHVTMRSSFHTGNTETATTDDGDDVLDFSGHDRTGLFNRTLKSEIPAKA